MTAYADSFEENEDDGSYGIPILEMDGVSQEDGEKLAVMGYRVAWDITKIIDFDLFQSAYSLDDSTMEALKRNNPRK